MSGEKTEQPTDKKLKDSRKKGQVAQSQDINKLFVTIVGFEFLIALKDDIIEKIQAMMEIALSFAIEDLFFFAAKEVATRILYIYLSIILLLLAVVIIARFCAGWVQFGFLVAPESLKPSLQKLNPVSNAKNLVSMKKVVELLANFAKALVLAGVFYGVIKFNLPEIALSATGTLDKSIDIGADVFIFAARLSLLIFGIISVLDFIAQKHFFIKSQKMTKDEVIREYKQAEGDPQVKAERKALGRELVESPPLKKSVDDASAIVVNPTHFAVVLRYVPGETPLPKVLFKGAGQQAQQVIDLAKEKKVPIIRYVWLARTLYSTSEVNSYIPSDVIQPTASVFRALRELEEAGIIIDTIIEVGDQ